MSFKDMLAEDLSNVFFDAETFGEWYRVEGKKILIVIDNDELKERQGGQDIAVAESSTLFHAQVKDLPSRRPPGHNLNVNGRECIIDDWQVSAGMATIALRENIVS